MSTARNPLAPEYFVYVLEADGEPFYVGIGRSKRASDRVPFVKYLMERIARGLPVKRWVFSNRVAAHHLRNGKNVLHRYLHENITRPEALVLELQEIKRLVASGVALANIQHNQGDIPRITY